LAYVTGLANQKLLLQNEYLAAENRILRAHLPTRMPFQIQSDRPSLNGVSTSEVAKCCPNPPGRINSIVDSRWRIRSGVPRNHSGTFVRGPPEAAQDSGAGPLWQAAWGGPWAVSMGTLRCRFRKMLFQRNRGYICQSRRTSVRLPAPFVCEERWRPEDTP
jgi:hypothetical protein